MLLAEGLLAGRVRPRLFALARDLILQILEFALHRLAPFAQTDNLFVVLGGFVGHLPGQFGPQRLQLFHDGINDSVVILELQLLLFTSILVEPVLNLARGVGVNLGSRRAYKRLCEVSARLGALLFNFAEFFG